MSYYIGSWKKLARDKHSSLFRWRFNDKAKREFLEPVGTKFQTELSVKKRNNMRLLKLNNFKTCFFVFFCLFFNFCVVVSKNCHKSGRSKANRREPKSCLRQVFNFKLGHFCCECNCVAYTNTPTPRAENSAKGGACKLAGENLKVVWAEFSTLI
jgi:hypothetical protein